MKILATILLAATLTFASVDSLRIAHQPPKIDTAFKAKFDSIKGNAFDRDSLKIKPIRVNRDSMFVFVKNDSVKTIVKNKVEKIHTKHELVKKEIAKLRDKK